MRKEKKKKKKRLKKMFLLKKMAKEAEKKKRVTKYAGIIQLMEWCSHSCTTIFLIISTEIGQQNFSYLAHFLIKLKKLLIVKEQC